MKVKSFTFGLGSGIILMTVIVYFFAGFGLKQDDTGQKAVKAMSDEEIVERGKALGMILYSELPAKSETKPPETEVRLNNSEIIERAKVLGMEFKNTQEPAVLEAAVPEAEQESDGEGEEQIYLSCSIPPGMGAVDIARVLKEIGVIDDAADFLKYMAQEGVTKKINSGNFRFKPGLTYEEVLKILIK